MALEKHSFSKPHLNLVKETVGFRTTLFFLPPWTSALCSVKYVGLHSLVQKAHDLQVSFFTNQGTLGSRWFTALSTNDSTWRNYKSCWRQFQYPFSRSTSAKGHTIAPVTKNFEVILDFFLLNPHPTYEHILLALPSRRIPKSNDSSSLPLPPPRFKFLQWGMMAPWDLWLHHLNALQLCAATLVPLLFPEHTVTKLLFPRPGALTLSTWLTPSSWLPQSFLTEEASLDDSTE